MKEQMQGYALKEDIEDLAATLTLKADTLALGDLTSELWCGYQKIIDADGYNKAIKGKLAQINEELDDKIGIKKLEKLATKLTSKIEENFEKTSRVRDCNKDTNHLQK